MIMMRKRFPVSISFFFECVLFFVIELDLRVKLSKQIMRDNEPGAHNARVIILLLSDSEEPVKMGSLFRFGRRG